MKSFGVCSPLTLTPSFCSPMVRAHTFCQRRHNGSDGITELCFTHGAHSSVCVCACFYVAHSGRISRPESRREPTSCQPKKKKLLHMCCNFSYFWRRMNNLAAVWISSAPRRPRGGGATDTFQSNPPVWRRRCASGLRGEAVGSKGLFLRCCAVLCRKQAQSGCVTARSHSQENISV